MSSSSEHSEEESSFSDDSDEELRVALKDGLLQGKSHLLNSAKKEKIYRKDEIIEKLSTLEKPRYFIESLAVTAPPGLSYEGAVDNDFEREAAFVKQAEDSVFKALPRLQALEVKIFRPEDYFAEMAKSDKQMQRVRTKLLDVQKAKEESEKKRRLREEKRFALKVQTAAEERKRKDKSRVLEAVKKHRKGMKAQLENMLNNAKYDDDEDDENGSRGPRNKMSRVARNKKYGYGGQKKRSKQNDKSSFENPFANRGKGVGGKFKNKNKASGRHR